MRSFQESFPEFWSSHVRLFGPCQPQILHASKFKLLGLLQGVTGPNFQSESSLFLGKGSRAGFSTSNPETEPSTIRCQE